MKNLSILAVCALVALGVACGGGGGEAPAASAPTAAPVAASATTGGGAINGVVTYANGDPDAEIKMDADPQCMGLHSEAVHSEKVVTDAAGNLANVFVYVKEGLAGSYPAPADTHTLDQNGCMYMPHVSGIMVGQTLVIRNSDPTLHNVHAMPKANQEFNQGQPFQGMELERTFDKTEVMVPFKCDVHPWMSSYIAVLDHPYFAVSGENGGFSIGNLPAGDYVVEAWHEEFGAQTQNVTVAVDGAVDINFDFSPTS